MTENRDSENKSLAGRKPERVIRPKKPKLNMNEPAKREQVRVRRDNSLIIRPSLVRRFFVYIHKNLYILGVLVLRKLNRYKRWFRKAIGAGLGGLSSSSEKTFDFIGYSIRSFFRLIKSPFTAYESAVAREKKNLRSAKEKELPTLEIRGRIALYFLRLIWRIIATIFNYTAPIVAAIFLYTIVNNQMETALGLQVIYKGYDLGYVTSEKDFAEARKDVDGRIVDVTDAGYSSGVPLYQIVTLDENKHLTSIKNLANGIIKASNRDIVSAFGLYANGELVGAVEDAGLILDEIGRIQEMSMTGKPEERVEFEKAIAFKEGLYPTQSLMKEQALIDKINSQETPDIIYTVQKDETLKEIAARRGISLATLQSLNPGVDWTDITSLPAGTDIYVSRARNFLSVKNIYIDVYNEELPFGSINTPDPLYAIGYRKITSAGVPGIQRVTAEVTMIDGAVIGSLIINTERISDPISEKAIVGVEAGQGFENVFQWPAKGGFIGTPLGGYPGHTGVDINGSGGIGSPIYASASGVVIKAVNSWSGYGNYIVIRHENGFETWYAHNTENYVSVGDSVGQGQVIGTVGSTGNSSGPHLHFEIRQYGQVLNPVDFVGKR